MKWLAAFAVATIFAGGAASAQDGQAWPTVPQVPAPVLHNGLPTNAPAPPATRTFSLAGMLKRPTAAAPAEPTPAPIAMPLPTGLAAAPLAYSPAACASPAACSTKDRGDCCERLKRWLCFKQCPVHLPHIPTPCLTPTYEYFACKPNAGYAGGCSPSGVGTGHGLAGGVATGRGLLGRSAKGGKCASDCDPRTGPVDTGLPGFRFAAAENPAVGGGPAAPGGVVSTSYKMPTYGAKK